MMILSVKRFLISIWVTSAITIRWTRGWLHYYLIEMIIVPIMLFILLLLIVPVTSYPITVSGLLLYIILYQSLRNIAFKIAYYREAKIWSLYHVRPVPPVALALGFVLPTFIETLPSVLSILLLSITWNLISVTILWLYLIAFIPIIWILGSMFGYLIGLTFKEARSARAAATLLLVFLVFVAPVFYPLSCLPQVVHLPMYLIPSIHIANILHFILTGNQTMKNVPVELSVGYFFVLMSLLMVAIIMTARLGET